MLTADHVHARRRKDELVLVPLGARRGHAIALAQTVVELARDHVGRPREELEEAWQAIEVEPRDRKLLDGIVKLVEDELAFESELEVDPVALRAEVFQRAARARRAGTFDRDALLAEVAREHGVDAAAVSRGLFGDLRGAQILRGVAGHLSARALVDGYDLAQAQAVLLRATRVVVTLERVDPGALRALLRKLKFLRLLVSVHREQACWRLEIDGPFSLFESVTKYGLALALALPSIVACGEHRIVADVRWGKERQPLRFVWRSPHVATDKLEPRLSDDALALRSKLEARGGPFDVAVADAILDLPGAGACVPDLVLTHRERKQKVYLEVMGFWSRDAVWKRVELVEAGLREPVLFCVAERLRVSEAVLPESASSALLVYKGVIPAAAVEAKALTLLGIPAAP